MILLNVVESCILICLKVFCRWASRELVQIDLISYNIKKSNNTICGLLKYQQDCYLYCISNIIYVSN